MLPTEDNMDLLNLCLTSTYFQYSGKHYKKLHGTAMGSPVSLVITEMVMQHVEESALATCLQTIPLWLRYVDDTFTAVPGANPGFLLGGGAPQRIDVTDRRGKQILKANTKKKASSQGKGEGCASPTPSP